MNIVRKAHQMTQETNMLARHSVQAEKQTIKKTHDFLSCCVKRYSQCLELSISTMIYTINMNISLQYTNDYIIQYRLLCPLVSCTREMCSYCCQNELIDYAIRINALIILY